MIDPREVTNMRPDARQCQIDEPFFLPDCLIASNVHRTRDLLAAVAHFVACVTTPKLCRPMGVVGPQSLSIMRVEMVGHDLSTRFNVDAIAARFASLAAVSALEQRPNQASFVPLALVQHRVAFTTAIYLADLRPAIDARKFDSLDRL
jgi:hypothetical protein